MLTEEAIKQTRFFRGSDEKVYLIVDVKNVKLATLINTTEGKESRLLLDDEEVCSQFFPVIPVFEEAEQRPKKQEPQQDSPKERSSSTTARQPVGIKRRRADKSSNFKGVSRVKDLTDGSQCWCSQYYNQKTKKLEHLGRFRHEFLAAAAWFERDGDKKEAARLRALVEEHEALNPDKPRQPKRKKKI